MRIKAQPSASKNEFCEVYGDDAIKIRIKAPAVEGAANNEFNEAVVHLGLEKNDLTRDDLEIVLTNSGRLHLDLMYKLEYVEIMKLSTYVPNDEYIDIQSEENQTTFALRRRGTMKFLNYLNREDHNLFETVDFSCSLIGEIRERHKIF